METNGNGYHGNPLNGNSTSNGVSQNSHDPSKNGSISSGELSGTIPKDSTLDSIKSNGQGPVTVVSPSSSPSSSPSLQKYLESEDFQNDPDKQSRVVLTKAGTALYKPTQQEMSERIDFTLGLVGLHLSQSQICRALSQKFGMSHSTALAYQKRAQRRARKFINSPIEDHFAQGIQCLRNIIADPASEAFARIAAQKEINAMLGLGRNYKEDQEIKVPPLLEIVVSNESEIAEFNKVKETMLMIRETRLEENILDEYGDDLLVAETNEEDNEEDSDESVSHEADDTVYDPFQP